VIQDLRLADMAGNETYVLNTLFGGSMNVGLYFPEGTTIVVNP
jgi:hypothetical protein